MLFCKDFGVFTSRSTFHVRLCLMSRFRAEAPVFEWLQSVVAENVILERLRVIRQKTTVNARFCSINRFQAQRRVFDSLQSVVAKQVILGQFRVIRPRSTFHVKFCSMSRSRAETRVFEWRRSLIAANVILDQFQVMRPRSTFRDIVLNDLLSSPNARFRLSTIFSSRKCYFRAIASYKAEIDISCEILLNESHSSRNTRFW